MINYDDNAAERLAILEKLDQFVEEGNVKNKEDEGGNP